MAHTRFFIFLYWNPQRKKQISSCDCNLACDMLQEKRLMFVVKCPVPHDGFPLSRGAYDYNRNMTDRERVQSVQPGADMAVPLFFRVFGRGRLF